MAHLAINEWGLDAAGEALGDIIRLMEHLLDGGSLRQAMLDLCRFLERQIPGSRALAARLDTQQQCLQDWHAPGLPAELLLELDDYPVADGSPWYDRLHSGQPSACGNLQQDSTWGELGNFLLDAGLRSALVMPVIDSQARLLGLLMLCWPQPRQTGPQEQLALRRAARLARIGIEHLLRQAALQLDEADYRQLVQATDALLMVVRGEQIEFVNPALRLVCGLKPDQPVDDTLWSSIHPDDQTSARATLLAAQRQTSSSGGHFRLKDAGGKITPVRAAIAPIRYAGHQAILVTLHRNPD